METLSYRARVFRHNDDSFKSLKNTDILIYWPHGVGDFVFLGYAISFFEPTNRYWVTRYGDDMVSVLEGADLVTPIYSGFLSASDGFNHGSRHFGLNYDELNGQEQELILPLALHKTLEEHKISAVFWSGFFETYGSSMYPYHSKARNLIQHVASATAPNQMALHTPLGNCISFKVDPWLQNWVNARLATATGLSGSRKLCLIGRNGHTNIEKNWGHEWRQDMPEGKRCEGEECRDFMRLLLKKDPNWIFLSIEDCVYEGEHTLKSNDLKAFTYAELFGFGSLPRLPFGLVIKALINVASLAIGVPAGVLFLCLLKKELPTVGVWIAHLPSWYAEPDQSSIHVISRNIRDIGIDQRPGSFEDKGSLHFRSLNVDSRIITGEQVLHAVEELLG